MTSKTLGEVTIPNDESTSEDTGAVIDNETAPSSDAAGDKEPTAHTEMQFLLLSSGVTWPKHLGLPQAIEARIGWVTASTASPTALQICHSRSTMQQTA